MTFCPRLGLRSPDLGQHTVLVRRTQRCPDGVAAVVTADRKVLQAGAVSGPRTVLSVRGLAFEVWGLDASFSELCHRTPERAAWSASCHGRTGLPGVSVTHGTARLALCTRAELLLRRQVHPVGPTCAGASRVFPRRRVLVSTVSSELDARTRWNGDGACGPFPDVRHRGPRVSGGVGRARREAGDGLPAALRAGRTAYVSTGRGHRGDGVGPRRCGRSRHQSRPGKLQAQLCLLLHPAERGRVSAERRGVHNSPCSGAQC